MARIGHLDGYRDGVVFGWAVDEASPAVPLGIVVRVNGEHVATAAADVFREDLTGVPGANGRCAYRVALPKELCDGRLHEIAVHYADSGEALESSPKRIALTPPLASARYHLMGRVDAIGDGEVHGWAFETTEPHERVRVRIAVDGAHAGEIVADTYREDLEQAGFAGGECAFFWEAPEVYHDGRSHRVVVSAGHSGARLDGLSEWVIAPAARQLSSAGLQAERERHRVQGRSYVLAVLPVQGGLELNGRTHAFDTLMADEAWVGDAAVLDLRPALRVAQELGVVFTPGGRISDYGAQKVAPILAAAHARAGSGPLFLHAGPDADALRPALAARCPVVEDEMAAKAVLRIVSWG